MNNVSKEVKSNTGFRGKNKNRFGGHFGSSRLENDSSKRYQNSSKNGRPSIACVQCQIYGRLNHSALTCYQRYNHASPSANIASATDSLGHT